MCPTSLHQICVTCSPQCMEMWLEAGEHLSFCQFARAVGFLKACLPNHSMSGAEKKTENVKKTERSLSHATYQWFLVTQHSAFKPWTTRWGWQSKELFWGICAARMQLYKNYNICICIKFYSQLFIYFVAACHILDIVASIKNTSITNFILIKSISLELLEFI